MIQSVKHPSVNWVDGMQISEEHYTAQERYISDSLRDVASFQISRFNYGLLPVDGLNEEKDIFDIFTTATNDVQLHVKKCNAVTAAGYRIDLADTTVNINSLSGANLNQQMEQAFYVIVTVNPFDRVPSGQFDSEEIPPRHLFAQPRYLVQLVAANDMASSHTSGNYLVVGKVLFSNGVINADNTFIPPCVTVDSHPRLLQHYHKCSQYMARLQQASMTILKKANHKSQHVTITKCITDLCRTMLQQFSNSYFQVRNMAFQLPPAYLISYFANLAHALYVSINTMQDADKEATLNYCSDWCNVAPHTLLQSLSTVVEINYNHYKTGEYMQQVSAMLEHLNTIWESLSNLDYLGQQRENIIVKEQTITETVKISKGWSPFD